MPLARFTKQRRVRRGVLVNRYKSQRRNWRGSTKTAATPTVASINPTTVVAGGANLTVTVTGTGFVSGITRGTVNGGDVATTFVSSTTINIVVPSTMMLSAVVLAISAHNALLFAPTPRNLTVTATE